MATIKDAKSDLRKQMKGKLSALDENKISQQSQKAQNLILSLPQYAQAKRLSIYLSMPKSEAQTDLLVQHALKNGKKVFVPYIHKPSGSKRKVIDMLRLHSLDEFEQGLTSDKWGIPSLPSDSVESRENAMGGKSVSNGEEPVETYDGEGRGDEGTLDLVVVPGVAFDEGMNRLGHGAGFYDAYFTRFCSDGTRTPFLGRSHARTYRSDVLSLPCRPAWFVSTQLTRGAT